MKVACIQPEISSTKQECYSEIKLLLKELLDNEEKCRIVCLPERWVPLLDDLPKNLQKERGQDYKFVKNLAEEHSISFISGAIWEKRDSIEKPNITSYFFSENGEEIGRQDKIHLYSYEREQFEAGRELNLIKLENSKFAILICFDMAFYETPRLAAEHGADLLISPTQIREEGMHNWNIYLQARALENRIPVVACNSVGSFLKRRFLGKSKIISFVKNFVSPSKLKIVEGPKGSGYIFDEIDLKFPRKIRKIRLNEKIEKNNIKVNVVNK